MISYLTGKILKSYRNPKGLFVDLATESGVGYRVNLPSSYSKLEEGNLAEFYCYTQVREDLLALYGFKTAKERDLFEVLISVPGVGPKLGLAIIAFFGVEEIKYVIGKGDDKGLKNVPGVGGKMAKKIILELQDKMGEVSEDDANMSEVSRGKQYDEVMQDLEMALSSLGFKGKELEKLLESAEKVRQENQGVGVEELIRKVLV